MESHKKTKQHNCNIHAEGLGQSYAGSLAGGSVSPYEPWLIDFCGVSCSVFDPSGSYNPFSSSAGFSELCLMVGRVSLHLPPLIAG